MVGSSTTKISWSHQWQPCISAACVTICFTWWAPSSKRSNLHQVVARASRPWELRIEPGLVMAEMAMPRRPVSSVTDPAV